MNCLAECDLLEIASFSPTSLKFPNAWIGHLPFAAWIIKQLSPSLFVELGTHTGNSYFSFCQAVSQFNLPTKCFAVDTWRGDEHAGWYGEEIFLQVSAHNQDRYPAFSSLLRMTFDEAEAQFADQTIDLLHIDGHHTYEAVRHDFETWLPKLAPHAVVLLHDTNVRERDFGVWKFWSELQLRYPSNLEFSHSHGLGVLQLGGSLATTKLGWLDAGADEKRRLITYFSDLGLRQLERYELSELGRRLSEQSGHISALTRANAERDTQLAVLAQTLSHRDEHIASLGHALTDRDGRIAALLRTLSERDQLLNALHASTSWRLTAPLRFVKKRFRQIIAPSNN